MSIIDLSKYLKTPKPKVDHGPEYYCLRCNSSFFRIKSAGEVLCGECGALMTNLKIEQTTPAA